MLLLVFVYAAFGVHFLNLLEDILLAFFESLAAFFRVKCKNLWLWSLRHVLHVKHMLINTWILGG